MSSTTLAKASSPASRDARCSTAWNATRMRVLMLRASLSSNASPSISSTISLRARTASSMVPLLEMAMARASRDLIPAGTSVSFMLHHASSMLSRLPSMPSSRSTRAHVASSPATPAARITLRRSRAPCVSPASMRVYTVALCSAGMAPPPMPSTWRSASAVSPALHRALIRCTCVMSSALTPMATIVWKVCVAASASPTLEHALRTLLNTPVPTGTSPAASAASKMRGIFAISPRLIAASISFTTGQWPPSRFLGGMWGSTPSQDGSAA
mmetsp:Transcript_72068/g.227466  ORF Transcript_72068/g.227466 Transcript_72068/m.227466 type:complete len:270 (-) Transcript_72068:38-847(-)